MQLGQNHEPHFVQRNHLFTRDMLLQHFAQLSLAMSFHPERKLTCTRRKGSGKPEGRGGKGPASRAALSAA